MPFQHQQKQHTSATVSASSYKAVTDKNTSFPHLQDNRPEAVFQQKQQRQLSNSVIQRQCDNPECTDKSCDGNSCKKKSEPIPYDPKQTHLGTRAMTAKGKPTLVVKEIHDGNYGVESLQNNKINTKKYREPQVQHQSGFGGTGYDEMVSTATTRDHVAKTPVNKRVDTTRKLSQSRVETSKLLWPTNDPKRPISGHPGGLSKSQTDMRKGLTGLHGSKDKERAKAVKKELNNSNSSGNETLDNAIIRAQMETTHHFMKPFEQMSQIDVSKSKDDAYHPKYGPLIQNGKKVQPNFDKAMLDMHKERERMKVDTAQKLIHTGKSSLVSDEMQQYLEGNYTPQQGPNSSLASKLDIDKSLQDYDTTNQSLPKPNRTRAVSPPRSIPNINSNSNQHNSNQNDANKLTGKKMSFQSRITDFYLPSSKRRKLNPPIKKPQDPKNDTSTD